MPGPWLRIVDCGDESRLGITKRSICHLRVFRLQQKPITTQEHSIRLSAVPVLVPSELYLSKLINVFVVSFDRLSVWWNRLVWSQQPFDPITKCICPTTEIYFSKYENVFVKNAKCICLDWEMYLLIGWACGGIDWCGRGNLSILVTPLTPPAPQLSRKPRDYYQLPMLPCSASPYNCRYQSPGNFPAGGRWCRRAVNTVAVSGVASPHMRLCPATLILPHITTFLAYHNSQIFRPCREDISVMLTFGPFSPSS